MGEYIALPKKVNTTFDGEDFPKVFRFPLFSGSLSLLPSADSSKVFGFHLRYRFTRSISSSVASAWPAVCFRRGSTTWKRTWPSRTSAISPLMAPRHAAMVCNTLEHSASSSNAFSIPLIWPLILLTRFRSLSLSLLVCAIRFSLHWF